MEFYALAEKVIEFEKSGKKIVKMHIGDTNLPAPVVATQAAIDYLEKEKPRYGSSAGLLDFRAAIAKRENCLVENVVVGPGSKHLIYALMSILLKIGDRVTTFDPAWPAYELICKQLNLKMEKIKTEMDSGWCPSQTEFDSKLIIICNPNNPTSTAYPPKWIEKVIRNAQKKGQHVILDEAYKELSFEKIPNYQGAIKIRSFSKEFNMEGYRLGYAIMPKEITQEVVKYNQITITCSPDFIQRAATNVLSQEEVVVSNNRKIWKERCIIVTEELAKAGFEFTSPQSGIYVFAKHPKVKDAGKFAQKLLDKESIAIAPGNSFGGYREFFRMCINQERDVLVDSIRKMGKLANSLD